MATNLSKSTMTQALLAALRERGWRMVDIAFVLRISETTIRGWGKGSPPRNEEIVSRLRELVDNPDIDPIRESEVNWDRYKDVLGELVARGWPVQVIARKLGYARQRMSQWRRGDRYPSAYIVSRLEMLLGETPPRTAREALLDLMARESAGGTYELGVNFLVVRMGNSRTTIDRYIEELEQAGMIRRLNSDPGKPHRWLLLVHPNLLRVSRNVTKGAAI